MTIIDSPWPTFQAETISPRLEQLVARYDEAKRNADAAAAALKEITDGIKHELTLASPGVEKLDVTSELLARPLRLQAIASWRVDSKKLKAEQPVIYASYAVQSVAWKLSAVGSGS